MMSLFFIVAGTLMSWLLICSVVWIWYGLFGSEKDASGDMGLAIMFLPIMPFMLAWHGLLMLVMIVNKLRQTIGL